MLTRILAGLTVFLFAQCTAGATIRTRQISGQFYAALSDWASIYSISLDLAYGFFNTISRDQPGAQIEWEEAYVQVEDMLNLIEESAMQLKSLAANYHPGPQVDVLTWDDCFILLSAYDPTWKAISSTSILLAKAAAVLPANAKAQFWSSQNITLHSALDLSGSVTQLCGDYGWYDEEHTGSTSNSADAECAMSCLAGLPANTCPGSNFTCPTFSA